MRILHTRCGEAHPGGPIRLGYCPQNHWRHPAMFCQNAVKFVGDFGSYLARI